MSLKDTIEDSIRAANEARLRWIWPFISSAVMEIVLVACSIIVLVARMYGISFFMDDNAYIIYGSIAIWVGILLGIVGAVFNVIAVGNEGRRFAFFLIVDIVCLIAQIACACFFISSVIDIYA